MSSTSNLVLFEGSYSDLCRDAFKSKKLCVCYFFATWCGPCRRFSTLLPDVVVNYPDVGFYKVDIDANASLSDKYGVKSVPTIKFFRPTSETELEELDTMVTCDIAKLKAKIEQHK